MQDVTLELAVLDHVGAIDELDTLEVRCLGTLILGVGEVAVATRGQRVRVAGVESHKYSISNHLIICPP